MLPGPEGAPVNPKKRPNHKLYLEVLRRLSPEQKLLKVFELSAFAKALFIEGRHRLTGGVQSGERDWTFRAPEAPAISPWWKVI